MASYGQCATLTALVITVLCGMTNGHTMDDSRRLLADIRANYTRELRPLYNQSQALEVLAGLDVLSIMEFDEVQERITVTAVLFLIWEDEYFTWDPQDYGGLDYIVTGTTSVWVPHILLTNAANEMDKITEDWHLLHIQHDGVVIYYPGDIFSATCSIDVTYYPLDVQTCSFLFTAWGYPPEQLKLLPYEDKVYFSYYSDNGAWTVKGSSAETLVNGELVSFGLKLERKPMFVVVNVILPLTFMSVLNVLIFLLPSESGERMSFCITVLLAIAVFLTLVGDILPKTSSPMSLYSYYLLSVLVISLCITLCTIFSLHLYHREESEPIGNCWQRLATCLVCQRKRKPKATLTRTKRYVQENHNANELANISTVTTSTYHNAVPCHNHTVFVNNTHGFPTAFNSRHIVSNSKALEQNSYFKQETPKRHTNIRNKAHRIVTNTDKVIEESPGKVSDKELRWKDISVAVDKVAFIFFVALIVLDNLIFLFAISRGRYVDA